MKKLNYFLFLLILSCGSRVTGTIPGITTQPVDITVKDLCENKVANRTMVVKSSSGEVVRGTDDNGYLHIDNVAKPYSITLGDGNSYITYYTNQSSITIYDPYVNCETTRDVVIHGNITAQAPITGTLKLFAFPGGVTTLSGTGTSVHYDEKFSIPQTNTVVYLIAVEYRDNEPYRAGRTEVQFQSGVTEKSSDIELKHSISRTLEGSFSGFKDRDKVTVGYTLLRGSGVPPYINSKELLHGTSTYEIPVPDKDFLYTEEKFAVLAEAELFNNSTNEWSEVFILSTFGMDDYPSSGNISINFSLFDPPVITSPQTGDTVSRENLNISWEFNHQEVPDFYGIKVERDGGGTEWLIIVDYNTSELKPEFPESLTPPFMSNTNYTITLFAVKSPHGGLRDFLIENISAIEGGYATYTERRVILR